jgi:competence protein ComEC
VAPRFAVASVGPDNHFGFPHPEIEARLARRGIALLRTDTSGLIVVETDGTALEVTPFRCAAGQGSACRGGS